MNQQRQLEQTYSPRASLFVEETLTYKSNDNFKRMAMHACEG
jgi:hypothetical protein